MFAAPRRTCPCCGRPPSESQRDPDGVWRALGKGRRILEALGTLAYSAASGIWQTVWIEIVPPTSIGNLLAVHACHDGNQQLIDVGVVDPVPPHTIKSSASAIDVSHFDPEDRRNRDRLTVHMVEDPM